MSESIFNLPNAIGVSSFLLSLVTYCLLRRLLSSEPQTPSQLYWAARICLLCGALKFGLGILEIYLGKMQPHKHAVGMYWGWALLLFAVLWLIRGSKLRRRATTVSAGYLAFNHEAAVNDLNFIANANASNAPVQVAVDASNSSVAPAANKSRLAQPLIRNAVPPSPFASSQGNELYVLPSIPMMLTKPQTPPETHSDASMRTPGHSVSPVDAEEEKIVNTQDHQEDAEDSIYVEEEPETNGGPERKTSEGNTTMC